MSATSFDAAMDFVFRWEGKYVNHPADPGGPTNYGISMRFLRQGSIFMDLDHDGDMDAADIQLMSRVQASDLYRRYFWLPMKCFEFPKSVATALMDTGVNMGTSTAVKLLQRAAGAVDDGKVGPATIGMVAAARSQKGQRDFLVEFLTKRMKRYTELSGFSIFGTGWTRRNLSCQDYCTGIELEGNV